MVHKNLQILIGTLESKFQIVKLAILKEYKTSIFGGDIKMKSINYKTSLDTRL